MKGFILHSIHENDRQLNVVKLHGLFPEMLLIEAVYPSHEKIPFLQKMILLSQQRTGKKLRPAEIGCLMSHRRIWSHIIQTAINENEHYLVLESDSVIMNVAVLQEEFENMATRYDIFFWGAWDGHMKLLHSTKQPLARQYLHGEPYIKTVYCTYGYSLNKKAAGYLLRQTKKIHYPVDQFKRYIIPGSLRIGGVMPELVSTTGTESYIKTNTGSRWYIRLYLVLLDFKNKLICSLK